jgi:predicted enzyme related to lactoylglutathione lyase
LTRFSDANEGKFQVEDVPYLEQMARRHQQLPRPRLCYLEIPALDAHQSAAFYEKVFGWDVRHRDTGRPSFAYPSADVTGAWVTGRAISKDPGLLPYIWVDHIDETLARIVSHGGEVVENSHLDSLEGQWIAFFRDPAGNVMGLYQEGSRDPGMV